MLGFGLLGEAHLVISGSGWPVGWLEQIGNNANSSQLSWGYAELGPFNNES